MHIISRLRITKTAGGIVMWIYLPFVKASFLNSPPSFLKSSNHSQTFARVFSNLPHALATFFQTISNPYANPSETVHKPSPKYPQSSSNATPFKTPNSILKHTSNCLKTPLKASPEPSQTLRRPCPTLPNTLPRHSRSLQRPFEPSPPFETVRRSSNPKSD